jgi:tetratricopeptide (TPR) repeat protein
MVSRLEKLKVRPSRELMEKISERLEVPMSYFYGEDSRETVNTKTQQLIKMIRKHLERREYESIAYLMESNEAIISKVSGENKLFFGWIEGVLLSRLEGKNDQAIDHLSYIEEGTKKGELRVEIIDSIGNLYAMKKDYEKAEEYYQKGFDSFNEWMNHETKAKLLLNYAICFEHQEKYRLSLEKTLQGLELLIENNTLYLLGDFFYQKGYCLQQLGQLKTAIEAYRNSLFVFEIQQNERYSTMAQLAISEVEEELAQNTTLENA